MKKILAMALVLLLLTGCANGTQEPSTSQTTAATQPGLYLPDSEAELDSNGALKTYSLENRDYYALSTIGDRLLLLAGEEKTRLEVYTGAECVLSGSAELPVQMQNGWQSLYNGFAYYDADHNQAVYLDLQLQEQQRFDMPADMQGTPAFAPDGGQVFYCVGQEIRALDTEKGLSRLIRSHSCVSQTLLGVYFDGTMVLCAAENTEGQLSYLYISTEDGSTKSNDAGIVTLDTTENIFFAERMDGITRQYIFGTNGEIRQLNVQEDYVVSAVDIGGAIGVSQQESGAYRLSFYGIPTGQKTGEVTLPQDCKPLQFHADRWSSGVWILAETASGQTLLHWRVFASFYDDETVFAGPVYTAQAPDEVGLDLLRDRVDGLNRTHGVNIRIWQTALKTTGGHQVTAEYQVGAISSCLDQVEQILNQFPENFLYKSVNDKIRICIVRSVGGKAETTHFWDDGDAFILLCPGPNVQQELLQAISYIVDSHILGNSSMVDDWENLNPEDFTYGAEAPDTTLLEGQRRAFANETAMASVSDDRAMLFWQAMQPDNGELFASETMQAKLLLLCRSIRDAWRLEKKTDTYPWEQYLNQSIDYVK